MKINFIEKLLEPFDLLVQFVNEEEVSGIDNEIVQRAIEHDKWSIQSSTPLYIVSERLLLVGLEDDSCALTRTKELLDFFAKKQFRRVVIDMNQHIKFFPFYLKSVAYESYTFNKYKRSYADKECDYYILVPDVIDAEKTYREIMDIIDAINVARDLSNEPPNYMTTKRFVSQIKKIESERMSVRIFEKESLEEMGANLIVSVGAGSANPPYLALLIYKGNANTDQCDLALVGKGICFDSGGLCLKSADGMCDMKHDMAGAAVLFGVMNYLAKKELKINVVCAIGIAENMPGAEACRPGDIVRSFSGASVEIINTDAEGRLVLADSISYVIEQYAPAVLIDIATLTGSVKNTLGSSYAGMFSNSQKLAGMLKQCGEETENRLWEFPLGKEYSSCNKSRWADIANVANSNGNVIKECGASTAAEFIRFFVQEIPWAHIDIAGTAYNQNGATGFGVELLISYLNIISQHHEIRTGHDLCQL